MAGHPIHHQLQVVGRDICRQLSNQAAFREDLGFVASTIQVFADSGLCTLRHIDGLSDPVRNLHP